MGVILKSANYALSCLDKWVAPKKAELPLVFFPAKGEVLPEPVGVVLIFSSWNFPITLALDPLIGAISAGNAVVLKPSELAPACSSFFIETIPLYLDNKAVKVIGGGADVGERLLELKWDKIFFTGSPQVGRLVMTAAARHLTPVTLELGGKCPAVVDAFSSHSKTKVIAKRIAGGKWGLCSGQACIAIELLKKNIKRFFGGNLGDLKCVSRIVNKHHFERIYHLLKDPHVASSIVHGGSVDEERLFVCDSLPFGGAGQSGFGRYHGKYSFDTFSHEKAVLHRAFFPELEPRYPPWNDFKLRFIKLAYRFDYFGLILLLLGLKKP
ncbi:Aldehyde dehydrogenase 3F1 isoform 3 [Theobroma cacao]|uniref:Aldehyde dehydrogenase 3F1 isoform 3 n=1 Tax=Theobroma cacao TaxID=3641 RepID=A0A061DFV3_THECC|nr:Aldehyde dehydrogenase 3F1 isoform 3 [Theobroma cacao]